MIIIIINIIVMIMIIITTIVMILIIMIIIRFALRYDTASATYTLQLKDVQRSDEGRYECQIIVGINNKVKVVILKCFRFVPIVAHHHHCHQLFRSSSVKGLAE